MGGHILILVARKKEPETKVDYLSCRIVKSGGTKIISQHVRLLKERGHDARLVTTDPMGEDLWGVPVTRSESLQEGFPG